MEQKNLSILVAGLTSTLTPAKNVPSEHFDVLKGEIAPLLLQQQIKDILPEGGLNRFDRINLQAALEKIEIDATVSPTEKTETTAEKIKVTKPVYKAVRREVPAITSQYAGSTPAWAAGMAIDHTLGPFIDNNGKWYWWDFYKIVKNIIVQRGSDQFLMIPFTGMLTTQQHYKLNAGSVWIRSQLISSSAPAGAFTGLKIKGGTLTFNTPVTVSGGNIIVIKSGDACNITIDLDQQADQAVTDTNTGDDARKLNIELPQKMHIDFTASFAAIANAADMKQQVYGNDFYFTCLKNGALFNPLLNRILIPYQNQTENVLSIANTQSNLFFASGNAEIKNSYWALPVTVSTISQLGNATGIGAIVMELKSGIVAAWNGLEKTPLQLNEFFLLTEPGRIAFTSPKASSKKAKQYFELWEEANKEKPVRSRVDVQFYQPVMLLFNCLSSGSETLITTGESLNASVDKPVTADNKRLKIEAPSSGIVMFEVKGERTIYIVASNIMQQLLLAKKISSVDPISFALKNAFFKTTPVDDFFLAGKWKDKNSIEQGTVALDCPMYFIMPTLPDPYVTNFYLNIRSVERSYAASAGVGMSLAALIQWNKPAASTLQLFFLPDATSGDLLAEINKKDEAKTNQSVLFGKITTVNHSDAVTQPTQPVAYAMSYSMIRNKIKEVQEEDAANTQNLRTRFNKELSASSESFFLLDVSTNADLFGVGVGLTKENRKINTKINFPFYIKDMDFITYAFNTRIYTLPQIQWEPIRTIQNPDVKPYPFPSPATSPNTGDPTIIGTESYELVPIAPKPVIDKFLEQYNKPGDPQKMAALFSLPFGMKSVALADNPSDVSKQGAKVSINSPSFAEQNFEGGIQISVIATSPDSGPNAESPGLKGATIQTRNLIDLLTGTIPLDDEGKPLSVLGPVVDSIFNGEFQPGGNLPRVPLGRMDISGYGATIFSNWLNPNAVIAATSQAKFDVIIGRTSHEIIQVKSILYPWGVAVVRTITIRRTSGGGVTRYDSGWKAQGPGLYDFSYYAMEPPESSNRVHKPNPFEIHPGVVKGMYNVTEIKDTGRIYRNPATPSSDPKQDVIMQEVFFNGDVLIEDVQAGAFNGYVPSKGQRGFVQLSPYQKPLTPQQYFDFLNSEGSLGGPLDCVINVGQSGQPMRIIKVDVSGVDAAGTKIFVSAGHGSIQLPKEGSWSLVKRQQGSGDVITIDEDSGLPIIREGRISTFLKKGIPHFPLPGTPKPYRFADPADIKQESTPLSDYGILHSTGSQKVLFPRPTIMRNDTNIKSTLTPYFADCYAILGSVGIFPNLNTTFPLGGGGTNLQILSAGKLKLTSGGNYKVPGGFTRDLVNKGDSRIYVDYSDIADGSGTTDVAYNFDSNAPIAWSASMKKISLVTDLFSFTGVTTITTGFNAAADKKPAMDQPKMKFGTILQPIVDIISFLGGFDMSQALAVSMGNATTDSWQPKMQGILDMEIEFKAPTKLEIKVAHKKVAEFGADVPEPQIILGLGIALKAYFNWAESSNLSDSFNQVVSSGATLEIEGSAHILLQAPFYAVGILGFEFGIDDKEGKSFSFKIAVGLEIRAEWDVVGEVAVMLALGLEMEWTDAGSGIFVIMIFKGEAELLEGFIVIGISIEAKGGQEKELEDGVEKTFAICEVEFGAEISIAFVIHIEFDITWQEKREIA